LNEEACDVTPENTILNSFNDKENERIAEAWIDCRSCGLGGLSGLVDLSIPDPFSIKSAKEGSKNFGLRLPGDVDFFS
jgi:hypothetical protein